MLLPCRLPLAVALVTAATAAGAAPQSVDLGATRATGRVASFRELRDRAVVKQEYDYSCGAAAFATLLRHGFGEAITEEEILRGVFADASEAEERLIKNKGLSLLDMQKLARQRGYRAQGFRLAAGQLRKLGRPVIVFIRPLGYEHFAVLKGVRGDRAYLADPSQGNWTLAVHRFLDMWADEGGQGVIFVVERPDGTWAADGPLRPRPGWLAASPLTARQLLEVSRPTEPPRRAMVGP